MDTGTNNNISNKNKNLENQFIQKMKKDLAEAEALIKKLGGLAKKLQYWQFMENLYKEVNFGQVPAGITKKVNALKAEIKEIEGKLNALDPEFKSLDNAISALEQGESEVGPGEDYQMFDQILSGLEECALDQYKADLYLEKIKHDGNNIQEILKDAMHALQANAKEDGDLNQLTDDILNDMKLLNQQKNAAQEDLDSYDWLDDAVHFGSDESQKDKDRAIIHNAEVMDQILTKILTDIAPMQAGVENMIYLTADITLDQLYKELKKILEKGDGKISPADEKKIKVMMAFALGILSQIQSAAAQEKADDRQTEVKATNFAVEMNIENEKAQYRELQEELANARMTATVMKVVKIVTEAAGCLLAPGLGSLMVMIALAVLSETGQTKKATDDLAKAFGGGKTGNILADVTVAVSELVIAGGGGAGLDEAVQSASTRAVQVVSEQVAEQTTTVVDTIVSKAMDQAEAAGNREVTESVVRDAVEQSVKKTVETSVIDYSRQNGATLVLKIMKQAVQQRSASFATVLAKAAEKDALFAAENALEDASSQISTIAQAAANGKEVTQEEIDQVATRISNEAVARSIGATPEEVAKKAAGTSLGKKALWIGLYNAFNDGTLSYGMEQFLLHVAHKDKDNQTYQIIMEITKAIEAILASFAVMKGTGTIDQMSVDSTLAIKLGMGLNLAGTATEGGLSFGLAQTHMKESDTVKAVNKSKVNNEMLNLLMKEFEKQAQIDAKQAADRFSEQSSNFSTISHLNDNGNALAQVMATSAV